MAVRRESVRLDVEGNFDRKMFEYAGAAEVLKRSLKDLNGQSVQSSRVTRDLERDIDNTSRSARQGAKDIDTYSGRLGILAAAIGALAPAATPIGAVGIGGIAGIANDAGAATLAVGSLVVAMHGVAPAIKAVNKAALEPTAANLQAARLAMEQLSPAARQFVHEFQGIEPILKQVQASAASGWFPGLTRALHNLTPLAPTIEKIFHDVGKTGGDLIAQGAQALAGPQWRSFFKFIDTEMPKAMEALGHVVGSLAHGLAQLWMAFQPLNTSFNDWLVKSARSFDTWATGLSRTHGFQDFLDYVHLNGPKVAAAFEAIANAVIQIVQAAAPLGGPTLDAITALANAIARIADSPLGTPILALLQMASVARIATKAVDALRTSMLLTGAAGSAGKLGAAEGAAGGAAASKSSLGQAAILSLLGGTLANAGFNAVGNALAPHQNDLGSAQNIQAVVESIRKSSGFKGFLGGYVADPAKLVGFNPDHIGDKGPYQAADNGLAQLVASGNGAEAAKIFAKINAQVQDAAKYFPAYAQAVQQAGGADAIAAQQVEKHRQALIENKQALASAFDAETNYRSALVAAQKQAATNSAGIKGNSAAALANRAALAQLRDAWNNQSAAVQNNLVKQVQAKDAFIRTAVAMGVPIKQAQALSKQLLGIPTHINPIINILAHTQGIDEVLHKMQMLHDKTVNVWTYAYTIHKPSPGSNANGSHGFHTDPNTGQAVPNGSANGGTVPKTGRPYADRHLYLLADGEEVISNRYGQADRHRALLKAINANRMASGGTAGRWLGGGSSTVRHVIEVKVIGDELDLNKAKQQIHAIAREVSRDEVDQNAAWEASH